MSLQESLHWAVGRGRSKVAIGIHDLDTVKPPFRYIASPRSRKFIPLDYTEEMTMDEILEKHPKGRDYAKDRQGLPALPANRGQGRPRPLVPPYHQRRTDTGDDRHKEYPPRHDRHR